MDGKRRTGSGPRLPRELCLSQSAGGHHPRRCARVARRYDSVIQDCVGPTGTEMNGQPISGPTGRNSRRQFEARSTARVLDPPPLWSAPPSGTGLDYDFDSQPLPKCWHSFSEKCSHQCCRTPRAKARVGSRPRDWRRLDRPSVGVATGCCEPRNWNGRSGAPTRLATVASSRKPSRLYWGVQWSSFSGSLPGGPTLFGAQIPHKGLIKTENSVHYEPINWPITNVLVHMNSIISK